MASMGIYVMPPLIPQLTPNGSPNSSSATPRIPVRDGAMGESDMWAVDASASPSPVRRNANARSQKRLRASKRVKGLEPSTFSLGAYPLM